MQLEKPCFLYNSSLYHILTGSQIIKCKFDRFVLPVWQYYGLGLHQTYPSSTGTSRNWRTTIPGWNSTGHLVATRASARTCHPSLGRRWTLLRFRSYDRLGIVSKSSFFNGKIVFFVMWIRLDKHFVGVIFVGKVLLFSHIYVLILNEAAAIALG